MIRFRERMVGPVGPVPRRPWTIGARGPHGADGIVRVAGTTLGTRPAVLDLDALHVAVDRLDPVTDGFAARVTSGTVAGVATTPLPVDCGFADVLTRSRSGRRMHYRLLVVHGDDRYVVDGVKVVHGGVRHAWSATTTLHTIVVLVDRSVVLPEDGADRADRAAWLAAGGVPGTVVSAGVLRVRGLLRQGLSVRGRVLAFTVGFVRRAVRL